VVPNPSETQPVSPTRLLRLTITAHAPLAFPERKTGQQFRESLPYIPGAVIYGALGARGIDIDVLNTLRCHNAYPMARGDAWIRPLPATTLHPKGEKHKLRDSLVERVCWEQQQPPALIYAPTDRYGRPWESAGVRFYTLAGQNTGGVQLHTRNVDQRVLTRVAINRRRGTAEDSRLYSPLVLTEVTEGAPTCFCGSLAVPDYNTDLKQMVETIDCLGGRQSTGLGLVEVKIQGADIQADPAQAAAAIAARIDALTGLFQEQAAIYGDLGGRPWSIPDRSIFTINLLAHTLLLDRDWLPTYELSGAMLHDYTGGAVRARLVRAFTSTGIVGGWNVSWQQLKPTAVATLMGSLFVFQADAPLDQAACAALARLQLDGIGERRPEGYGQIYVCDDIHSVALGDPNE